jgi:ribosomal protein L40E
VIARAWAVGAPTQGDTFVQYVRCEACGAKAILAASRCPKCAHSLELRDHHGRLVDLSHCRKCDTYYPKTRGTCKWCGTKPTPDGARPAIYVAGGVVAALALGWFLLSRTDATSPATPAPLSAPAAPVIGAVTVSTPARKAPGADTLSDSLATTAVDTVRPLRSDTAQVPRSEAELNPPSPAPAVVTPPPPTTGATGFTRSGSATVGNYVNVRRDADRTSAIIGTLAPGTRVETGARFRGWRQIRAGNLVGWIDPRHLQRSDTARY